MRILLDTHILLWASTNQLPAKAKEYLKDSDKVLFFSVVSLWEIEIKNRLKRKDFDVDINELYYKLCNSGYKELSVESTHVLYLQELPEIHKDPFDRIMVAQALSEKMPFLTADKVISDYPGSIIYVGR